MQDVGSAGGGLGARTARRPRQIEAEGERPASGAAGRRGAADADAQDLNVAAIVERVGQLQRGARHARLAEPCGGEVERDPQRSPLHR